MQNNNIVITKALRTAVGSLGKSLKNVPAPNLSAEVILSLLAEIICPLKRIIPLSSISPLLAIIVFDYLR